MNPDVQKLLPFRETLDDSRFERMSGADTQSVFKRFEPDMLGEYFVLTSLLERNHLDRQTLIDAALAIGKATPWCSFAVAQSTFRFSHES